MGYCRKAFWELLGRDGQDGLKRGSTNGCYHVFLHSYLTRNVSLDEPCTNINEPERHSWYHA
jgi:hypothetical protein